MTNGPEDGAAFAQSLSAFKERGSNLLVVGGLLESAQQDACQRLLGDHPDRPRRRVFVRTDGTSSHSDGHCGAAADRTRVVERTTTTRSAAAASTVAESPAERVPEDDAGALARAVEDAIDELAPADGYESGELRVCFDTLVPLFAEHDDETVVRTLSLVADAVRGVDGMGHYHLPVERHDRVVGLLEPLFDAVIEVRIRDGRSEHNWSLVDRDVESGWLSL